MRILLVEDDELLGDGIRAGLKQYGHAVDWLKDGGQVEHVLHTEEIDIVILDLGLPKKSGLEILKNIRSEGNRVPVLILTARDSIQDRITGLDTGADDYLTKPFEFEELAARVRALRRRGSSESRAQPKILFRDIVLDPASHSVTKAGELVNLPRREFALLQKLLENAGRTLSRDQLAQSLYSWDEEVDSNALEVHVHNLRKKFGSDLIKTIRGVGYMIVREQ